MFRPLWYIPLLTALTCLTSVLCLLARLFSRRAARFVTNEIWSRFVLWPGGLRLEVSGRENLPPDAKGLIVYANHNSLLDIPAVALATGLPLCWVAKDSLGRLPFFGWALASAHLLVDRNGGPEAVRRLSREAPLRLARGEVLSFFPEGTRRHGPEALSPFKKGAFIMAKTPGARLLPVALKGTGELWPAGRFSPRPGRIRARIGQPLPPVAGEKTAALADRAREALSALLADGSW